MSVYLLLCSFLCVLMNFSTSVFLNDDRQYEDLIINVDPGVKDFSFLNVTQGVINSFSKEISCLAKGIIIKNVKLILPATINVNTINGAENFTKETLEDESLPQRASIQIGPSSSLYENRPYTLHLGGCGQPGEYIHLTPDVFGKESDFGNAAFVLLHEWAHYRWGMFDEYVAAGSDAASYFYFTDKKMIKPIGCPDGLKGWLATAGPNYDKCQRTPELLPQPGCQFHYNHNSSMAISILMGYANVKRARFCTKSDHNPNSPSIHNVKCGHQSASEIFTRHLDYSKNKNKTGCKELKPPRITLVTRRSSEKNLTILIYVDQRLEESIKKKLKGAGRILSHYTILSKFKISWIDTNFTEDKIKNKLTAEGNSIWIVQNPEHSKKLPRIFKKDKTNFLYPSSSYVKENITSNNQKVVVTFPDGLRAVDIANTLLENVVSRILPKEKLPVLVHSQRFESGQKVSGSFTLDADCGEALFIANTDNETENTFRQGTLYNPEGKKCSKSVIGTWCKFAGGNNVKDLAFKIMETNETLGKWKYNIIPTRFSSSSVLVVCSWKKTSLRIISRIFSKDSESDGTFDASLKNNAIVLAAALLHGMNPVLNATVSARIHSENKLETYKESVMQLYDDGIGLDIVKNDGIYTTEFVDFKSSGLYSFSFLVNTNNSEVLVPHKLQKNGYGTDQQTSNGRQMPNPFSIPTEENMKKLRDKFGEPKSVFSYEEDLLEPNENETAEDVEEFQPIPELDRHGPSQFMRIQNYNNETDTIDPGQVSDLKVIKKSHEFSTVTLEWTSVGDDGLAGQAERIEFKYSTNGSAFPTKFHNHESAVLVNETMLMEGSSLVPLEARTKHKIVVKVPKGNRTYPEDVLFFFALIYYDEAHNKGEVSNVAAAFFKPAKYSEELKKLFQQHSAGGVILVVFLFFLLCLGAFICAVKWFHRRHQYGANRDLEVKLTNT